MADATWSEIRTASKNALLRIANGAKFVTVNGQQFHYSNVSELEAMISLCDRHLAEEAGTDGRGAWEATFSEQD